MKALLTGLVVLLLGAGVLLGGQAVRAAQGFQVAPLAPNIPMDREVLQDRDIAALRAQLRELEAGVAALRAQLAAVEGRTVFHCEGSDSVSADGRRTSCAPHDCNEGTGQCYRPFCASTNECAGGFVCDVGRSNLCVRIP